MEPSSRISCPETEGKNHQVEIEGHMVQTISSALNKDRIGRERRKSKDLDHGTGLKPCKMTLWHSSRVFGYEKNFELSV